MSGPDPDWIEEVMRELLSEDVDAIYLGLGGADAVNFLNQYQQAGGEAHLIGGSIMVDQTVLSSKGKAKEAGPSLLAISYYNSADAVFNALDQVNGELSDGNKKFRVALQNMVLDAR
jgi:ABC-type branched-subunit amino acid transport system substrate-binding protein